MGVDLIDSMVIEQHPDVALLIGHELIDKHARESVAKRIVVLCHVGMSIGLHELLLIDNENSTQTGGYPQLPLVIFEQVIGPIGVVTVGAIYNIVGQKSFSSPIVAIDASIGGNPQLLVSIFVNVSDAIVRKRMVRVSYFVPKRVVFSACGVDELDESVGASKPIGILGIFEEGVELVALSGRGDLGDGYILESVVVSGEGNAVIGSEPNVTLLVGEDVPNDVVGE